MNLPVLNCNGCPGACCQHMESPPFVILIDANGCAYAHELTTEPEWIAAEIGYFNEAPEEARKLVLNELSVTDGPCSWLDQTTGKCKYYEFRPGVCRDFEVGKEDCLAARARFKAV